LLEIRHHGAANIASFGVGKDAFDAVSDFDPVLAVVGGDEDQNTPVRLLLADLPYLKEVVRVLGDGFAVESMDGYEKKLRTCPIVKIGAQGFKFGADSRGENAGVVVDITRWLRKASRGLSAEDANREQ
jgi:hypothetical protein